MVSSAFSNIEYFLHVVISELTNVWVDQDVVISMISKLTNRQYKNWWEAYYDFIHELNLIQKLTIAQIITNNRIDNVMLFKVGTADKSKLEQTIDECIKELIGSRCA